LSKSNNPTPGKLIILNGGSSSGKSSLAKAFQEIADELYLFMGADAFWFSLPPREVDLVRVEPQYFTWTIEGPHDFEYFRIIPGPILDRLMVARYRAIAGLLDSNFNVIADELIWKRLWLEESLKILQPYQVTFVGVRCEDKVLTQRESRRKDRKPGWARGSALYAHEDCLYDVEIDTTFDTAEAAAAKLKEALRYISKPTAFQKMSAKLIL
jgi:chloramphenicol 3-O phosphotransferase